MRILATCLLVVSFDLPLAQASQTLRDRYGEPDIERYTAAHDIGLTVLLPQRVRIHHVTHCPSLWPFAICV
jgi:hypothetical protein